MVIPINREEKNELMRDILDRVSYCKGYKEELLKLNARYNPHENVNYSVGVVENKTPLFPLNQVLS